MLCLKVEYHVDFGRGSKTPPAEIEWKAKNLPNKLCGRPHDFGLRFRYHTVERRHALSNALWQQKLALNKKSGQLKRSTPPTLGLNQRGLKRSLRPCLGPAAGTAKRTLATSTRLKKFITPKTEHLA